MVVRTMAMKTNFIAWRLVLLAVGALVLAVSAQADTSKEETTLKQPGQIDPYGLGLGLQGGLAFGNASVEPVTPSTNRVGLSFGAYAEVPMLPGFFYLQPELNFLQKGAENAHFGTSASARLNYLEMPLLAKIKLMIPRLKPFLLAGPTLAYMVGGTLEGTGDSLDRSRFNNLDIGLLLGVGFGFQLGETVDSSELTVSLRYTSGLNNLDAGANQWKSNVLSLLVGIQI